MSSIASLPSSASEVSRAINVSWLLQRAAAVLLGSSLLWASAKVQLPFWPVPMTMQTYVILTMGALFGWRLGAVTVVAYLAEGALGLPVFAGTPANGIGLAYMAGPTGGYLAGYVAAVVLVGTLVERNRDRSLFGNVVAVMAGEMVILGIGCAWLAVQFGWQKAFALGFGPFLVGDAVKLALVVGTISYGKRWTVRERL